MGFNRTTINSFVQVIFRKIYWIRSWSLLFKEERDVLKTRCSKLQVSVMEIFICFSFSFLSHATLQNFPLSSLKARDSEFTRISFI